MPQIGTLYSEKKMLHIYQLTTEYFFLLAVLLEILLGIINNKI